MWLPTQYPVLGVDCCDAFTFTHSSSSYPHTLLSSLSVITLAKNINLMYLDF